MRTRGGELLTRYRFAAGPTLLSVGASGLSAATTLGIAREIGAGEFGGYTVVLTVGTILLVGTLLNLNVVLYQELPRRPEAEHAALIATALAVALALGVAVTVLTTVAAVPLRSVLGVDAATLRWSVLFALTTGFAFLAESLLRGRRRYTRVAALKLVQAVGYLAAAGYLLLVREVDDFGTYLALLSASNVVFGAVALAGQPLRPRLASAPLARRVLAHGGYVSGTAVLLMLAFNLDVIFVSRFYPDDVVGAYSIYNGFPKRLLGILFTEGVGLVLLPTLATLAKPELLRRIGRIAPLLGGAAAVVSFVASVVVLRFLAGDYPYSFGLMALSAAGIGVHTVFNLYYFALSVDGTRGAKTVIVCLAAALPATLAGQALLIGGFGLAGGLVAFIATNVLLIGSLRIGVARVYLRLEPEAR